MRAATSAGALKTLIESGGLKVSAYRDRLPGDAPLPVITIDDDVTSTTERHGDTQDPDGHHGEAELVFVHLWQPLHNQNRRPGERFDLARNLTRLLKTAQPFLYGPDDAPVRVYGIRIDGRARIIEGTAPNEIVHTTLTVTMRRDL